MNEKKGRRREWVKTAAIVFLSVMLVLTFFSNTIMNYSLPEVAGQNITSGTITSKVRGTGVVESGSLYNVKVTESRKVLSVEVRQGDIVAAGDVICYLAEGESTELQEAKKTLDELQDAYEAAVDAYNLALLTGDYHPDVIQNAGTNLPISAYKDQLTGAQAEVNAQQSVVDSITLQMNELKKKIGLTSDASAAEWQAVQAAAAANVNSLSEAVADWSVSDGNAALSNKKKDLENAQITLQNVNNIVNQLNTLNANLADAEALLAQKQETLELLRTSIGAIFNLHSLYDGIAKAREAVAEQNQLIADLESKAAGGTITADVAGTITAINVVAGESTSPDNPVAVIQPEGKGFTLSFSVTNQQAQKISVGDPGELVNSWWYNDVTATVASIKPDPSSPNTQKLVTFNLTGNLTAGQTLSLQVGQKSANYDNIVPNSAIREDNNGKFILVVETKSSPLGNRYYATRYDVEVLASDDTQSAVSGALYGYEFVITTATKPVEAGQMVRLPD